VPEAVAGFAARCECRNGWRAGRRSTSASAPPIASSRLAWSGSERDGSSEHEVAVASQDREFFGRFDAKAFGSEGGVDPGTVEFGDVPSRVELGHPGARTALRGAWAGACGSASSGAVWTSGMVQVPRKGVPDLIGAGRAPAPAEPGARVGRNSG
jgi:hypothetical protein